MKVYKNRLNFESQRHPIKFWYKSAGLLTNTWADGLPNIVLRGATELLKILGYLMCTKKHINYLPKHLPCSHDVLNTIQRRGL